MQMRGGYLMVRTDCLLLLMHSDHQLPLPFHVKPIFQREALWIDFRNSSACAVKVSVGGESSFNARFIRLTVPVAVNALTGEPRSNNAPSDKQDYAVLPKQDWLDGICTSPGVVRQVSTVQLGWRHNASIPPQVCCHETWGKLYH